jgi:pilus assembly protein CpaE
MASEIRVVLVEEAKDRTDLRKLLSGESISLVAEAGFGTEAITVTQQAKPDVVVLSLEEPIARPLRTIETLFLASPNVGVIVVSTLSDRDVMRKAMRAGARDYVVRPVGPGEVERAVEAVHQAELRKQQMKPGERDSLNRGDIFVVFGAKGGIGKTTLSVNLATAIAKETNQRVALIDLDIQMGDVALVLSLMPERSVADAAFEAERLDPEYLQTLLYADRSGVRVLPSPAKPEESADVNATQVGLVLEALARTFDYVVVDTSPTLNDLNITALERATMILLLTTPELPSLKRTKISLDLMLKIWNYPEDRIKLVMNYPASHNGVGIGDVASTLEYPVFWKVPYDNAVSESIKNGRPLVEARPNAKFSRNVTDLARAICGLQQKAGVGLFGLGRR